jgi:hypothetical protein
MNKTDILKSAEECITVDRQATHGDAEDNFSRIAGLWTAYFDNAYYFDAKDVAAMMVLFKMARYKANPSHPDNMIDACGYAAFAGEMGANAGQIERALRVEFNDY